MLVCSWFMQSCNCNCFCYLQLLRKDKRNLLICVHTNYGWLINPLTIKGMVSDDEECCWRQGCSVLLGNLYIKKNPKFRNSKYYLFCSSWQSKSRLMLDLNILPQSRAKGMYQKHIIIMAPWHQNIVESTSFWVYSIFSVVCWIVVVWIFLEVLLPDQKRYKD